MPSIHAILFVGAGRCLGCRPRGLSNHRSAGGLRSLLAACRISCAGPPAAAGRRQRHGTGHGPAGSAAAPWRRIGTDQYRQTSSSPHPSSSRRKINSLVWTRTSFRRWPWSPAVAVRTKRTSPRRGSGPEPPTVRCRPTGLRQNRASRRRPMRLRSAERQSVQTIPLRPRGPVPTAHRRAADRGLAGRGWKPGGSYRAVPDRDLGFQTWLAPRRRIIAPRGGRGAGPSPLGRSQADAIVAIGQQAGPGRYFETGTDTLAEITEPMEVDRLTGLCYQRHPHSSTVAFEKSSKVSKHRPVQGRPWPATGRFCRSRSAGLRGRLRGA